MLKYVSGAIALAIYGGFASVLWRSPLPIGAELNGLLIGFFLVGCCCVVKFLTSVQQIRKSYVKGRG